MTQIEQIITEIERLKIKKRKENLPCHALYYDGYDVACDEIIAYINSLPAEQPSEDVEEAANIYANKQGLELKPFAIKFFKSGANWQKEQMMKGLCFETKVYQDCDRDDIESPFQTWLSLEQNETTALPNLGLSDGDKVKVIIVKEDEQ